MFLPAENGNDWMQNWSFTLNHDRVDPYEPAVSLGTIRYTVSHGAKMDLPNLFAQAEMFFDCNAKWHAPVCNGPGKKAYDYAIYGLKWRERLRRFHIPSFGELLGGLIGKYLGSGVLNLIGGNISQLGLFQDLKQWASGFGGEYGQAFADDAFGWLSGKADDAIGDVTNHLVKIPGAGSGPTSLILH
jgi:hypothetical protein